MGISELDVGTVFRVVGSDEVWLKATDAHLRKLGEKGWETYRFDHLGDGPLEIVRRPQPAPVYRAGDWLHLSEGDVRLDFLYPWLVRGTAPDGKLTKFVLHGSTFEKSVVDEATEDTALPFTLARGCQHLGRQPGSMIFAYKGRVYARATPEEVTGKKMTGGYKRHVRQDKASRLVIFGFLCLPQEGALYDLIQDHFGPTAPPLG